MRGGSWVVLSIALIVVAATAAANTPPVASFSAYRVGRANDPTILFDASASADEDGEVVRFQWVFGDGTTGSGMRVEHTYPKVDRYIVTLVAADDVGAWHMITRTVNLADLPLASPESTAVETPIGREVGQRAPGFRLPGLDGEPVNLSDFRGRVVLLVFWRSDCPGCQATTPDLEALRQGYADRGFVVFLISLDDRPADAATYLADNGYEDFVVAHEARPLEFGIGGAFGVTSTPYAFLVDRGGVIRLAGRPELIASDVDADWL